MVKASKTASSNGLSSKERFKTAIKLQKPDRPPFNFWMDRRLMQRFDEELGKDFRVTHYGADIIETFPLLDWPRGNGVLRDGSFWHTHPPLIEDWSKAKGLPMPNPAGPHVFSMINETLFSYPDKAVIVNIPGPFTVMHGLRLMDNLYTDVYDYPEEIHKLARRIMKVQNTIIEEAVKLPVSGIYFQDDIASSGGLLFSKDMCKEFILDYLKPGIEIAKNAGLPVLFHSDGAVIDILEELCLMGIDAINPLQPEFNNFDRFYQEFGNRLAVYGGIDNTKIIPYGSKDDIRSHINMIFEKLGHNGGLMMSSHDIPFDCPKENIDYMIETIKGCMYA